MKKENQDTKKAMLRIVEDEEATSGTSSLNKKQAEETDASSVAQSEELEESVVAKDETEDTETATEAADNEAIKRYVEDEEDEDEFGEISLKSILGGDILQSKFFVRQVIFVLFVVALMLAYTANRYNSQQEIITIDSLKLKLQEERYNVLTQSSELLNLSRQSNIEVKLKENGDSALVNPTTPPFEVK
ncbi:MAG: hypothetical protein II947_07760 [Bacteroidaceae bacterium]|nr:hypothetical protein [Bacteroidaceae bacterium]